MSPLRVFLTVNYSPWAAYAGGGQRSTHQLATALSELGHDALAIGIRPTHTMFDGDVVFTLSTGDGSRATPEALFALGAAATDAVGEAIERSVGA